MSCESIKDIIDQINPSPEITESELTPIIQDLNLLSQSYSIDSLYIVRKKLQIILIKAFNEDKPELMVIVGKALSSLVACYSKEFMQEAVILLSAFPETERTISEKLAALSAVYSEELLQSIQADLHTVLVRVSNDSQIESMVAVVEILFILAECYPSSDFVEFSNINNKTGSIMEQEWQRFQHPFLKMRLIHCSDGYLFDIVELMAMGKKANEKSDEESDKEIEEKYLNPYTGVFFSEDDQNRIQRHPHYILINNLFEMYSKSEVSSSSSSNLSDDNILLDRLKKIFFVLRYDSVILSNAKIEDASLLDLVIEKNYMETFKFLLSQNCVVVNAQNRFGRTILHCAVIRNRTEMVLFLLIHGANAELLDWDDLKPQDFAIGEAREEIRLLLEFHEDSIKDTLRYYGPYTVLSLAGQKGYMTLIGFLYYKHVNLNCRDKNGDTALHCAVHYRQTEMVKFLLDRGANVGIVNKGGMTPLTLAIDQENTGIISAILEKNPLNIEKFLFCAVKKGNVKATKFFLDKGADIHEEDTYGNTALCLAVMYRQTEVLRVLLENGNSIQSEDVVPLLQDVVIKSYKEVIGDYKEIIETFAQARPDLIDIRNFVFFAYAYNKVDTARFLRGWCLEHSVWDKKWNFHCLVAEGKCSDPWPKDINAEDWRGRTALHWAAAAGKHHTVRTLLDNGAEINYQDHEETIPLHLAAHGGWLQVVEILMFSNLDCVLKKDKEGKNVLHYAAEAENVAVMRNISDNTFFFLEAANTPDNRGQTPLHIAAKLSDVGTVTFLLKSGVNVSTKDKNDCTALDLARRVKKAVIMDIEETVRLIEAQLSKPSLISGLLGRFSPLFSEESPPIEQSSQSTSSASGPSMERN